MKELLARVRSMVRRRDSYDPGRTSFSDIRLNGETFELSSANAVRLSVKEFELMRVLMNNPGRGLTAKFLLDHVWRQDPDETVDTVCLYVSYLRGKLKWVGSTVTIEHDETGYRLRRESEL